MKALNTVRSPVVTSRAPAPAGQAGAAIMVIKYSYLNEPIEFGIWCFPLGTWRSTAQVRVLAR
jgi:hypothetical protein